nr:hypothetical protein [Tanacetum cinerariifolium]
SPDYSPDSDSDSEPIESDSRDKDLTETVESLHTQTALTPVVQLPPTRPLPTSSAIVLRPRKEIPLPPSVASPFSLPPSLLPSSSHKRSRLPSPPPPSVVPPPPTIPIPPPVIPPPPTTIPLPPAAVSPPPPGCIELVKDDVETLRARLASSLLEITKLHSRVEYAETHLKRSHVRQTGERVCIRRAEMTEKDVEALHARAERQADRLEMDELRSRAYDIEASLWETE